MITKPKVLFINSYPPRECGIATFTQDTINAINKSFKSNFDLVVAALNEHTEVVRTYPSEVMFEVEKSIDGYIALSEKINADDSIKLVVLEHEFGLYSGEFGKDILELTTRLTKPYLIVLHTVLPKPEALMQSIVYDLIMNSTWAIVMTAHSMRLLTETYQIPKPKIKIIPHGFHLRPSVRPEVLKAKYNCENKIVLSTFGLLSRNKGIELALDALKQVTHRDFTIYFVLGKTHPEVKKHEGESYREFLEQKVRDNGLEANVRFINRFLELDELLEYLEMTDIYLFTSKDPLQAISGTLTYALGARCAVLTTPISHAKEILDQNAALSFDFGDSQDLASKINKLIADEALRKELSIRAHILSRKGLWENIAIAYAQMFKNILKVEGRLVYTKPTLNLDHFINITDEIGMYQFTDFEYPNKDYGYTLDDNARALYVLLKYRALHPEDESVVHLEAIYLNFIKSCQLKDGIFLNYVDEFGKFTDQNYYVNTDEAASRAVLGLCEVINSSLSSEASKTTAKAILNTYMPLIPQIKSPRAVGKLIKAFSGLMLVNNTYGFKSRITTLADYLCDLYDNTASELWHWFENNLSYSNSDIPEGLFYAFEMTKKETYKTVAVQSLEFLIANMYHDGMINPISNRSQITKESTNHIDQFGQQPVEIASLIECLEIAYKVTNDYRYYDLLICAFTWFMGNNVLHQIVYNPATGGGHDGIEEHGVNLNQGAESTLSYLVSLLTVEKLLKQRQLEEQVN